MSDSRRPIRTERFEPGEAAQGRSASERAVQLDAVGLEATQELLHGLDPERRARGQEAGERRIGLEEVAETVPPLDGEEPGSNRLLRDGVGR